MEHAALGRRDCEDMPLAGFEVIRGSRLGSVPVGLGHSKLTLPGLVKVAVVPSTLVMFMVNGSV
jgi:hypothetical protein